jgi:hypothetical protein
MNIAIKTLVLGATLAGGIAVQGETKLHSKTIVVESPSSLPQLARKDGTAMYLHDTSDGRTFLYIESKSGEDLSVLDVTDPTAIKAVAHVPVPASGPFDFVQDLNDSAVLVRYQDRSGYAILNLRKYDRPVFSGSPQLTNAGAAETLGTTGLLLSSAKDTMPEPSHDSRSYDVVDTSNPSEPVVLATVAGVKQRLSRPDTGTIFLLSEDGVTVVRLLQVEERHVIDLLQNTASLR